VWYVCVYGVCVCVVCLCVWCVCVVCLCVLCLCVWCVCVCGMSVCMVCVCVCYVCVYGVPVGGSPCTACGQEEAQRGSHTVTHNLQETDCSAHGSRPRAGPDWPGWSHGQPLINHCIWKDPRQSEPHPRPEETRRSGIVPIKPCVCVCVVYMSVCGVCECVYGVHMCGVCARSVFVWCVYVWCV